MHLRGRTSKQCLSSDGDILYLFLWLPSSPVSPKASYWQKLLRILVTIKLPFYSSLSQSILYWQKFLLIFACCYGACITHLQMNQTRAALPHVWHIWTRTTSSAKNHKHAALLHVLHMCARAQHALLSFASFWLVAPHRSLTKTNRWLHSRWHPMPFPLTPFYSSLSQSILYWQKFLLIFATIMAPHRSPTTDRSCF